MTIELPELQTAIDGTRELTAALGEGGGIYNVSGTVDLDTSTVSGNIPNDCVNVPGC